MSEFNIKGRCYTLGISLTELFNDAKERAIKMDATKFRNMSFNVFSNALHGRYNYGMGPEFMSIANQVLSEKEKAR